MNPLLFILSGCTVVMALYLLSRKVPSLGHALGFVCIVASRIPILLALCMQKAAVYCQRSRLASLHLHPGGNGDYWEGVNVLSRLVYVTLAVCILAGETVNTLLVLPALWQIAAQQSPLEGALTGIVDIASAALFISCPAFFGAIIFECWRKIPPRAGLFLHLGIWSRRILGGLSGVLLLFTIAVNGYFYLFRAVYLADPQAAQGMVLYILGGLGIEVAAVSPFAVLALGISGAGVVSLLLLFGEYVCRITATGVALVPSLLDVVAIHLTQGKTQNKQSALLATALWEGASFPCCSKRRKAWALPHVCLRRGWLIWTAPMGHLLFLRCGAGRARSPQSLLM